MSETTDVFVSEIENVGGFFGGDTITLTVRHQDQSLQTITIDEHALSNVPSRFNIASGMLLRITHTGERIENAELLGASSADQLRTALGPVTLPSQLDQPFILNYWCDNCQLWLHGTPQQHCAICKQAL
jgi:hypothetical protein